MAIIRQAQADVLLREAISLDMGDLCRQGEAIRTHARAEAESILTHAAAERARLIESAAAQGRAEGEAAGRAAGIAAGREQGKAAALAEHRAVLEKLEQAWESELRAFADAREGLVLDARDNLLRLAMEIASRITQRVIAQDPGIVVTQLEEAVRLVMAPTKLTVSLHPDDEPICKEALPRVLATFQNCREVQFTPDSAMARGSIVVRTASGAEIDASISTQLNRIAEVMLPDSGSAGR